MKIPEIVRHMTDLRKYSADEILSFRKLPEEIQPFLANASFIYSLGFDYNFHYLEKNDLRVVIVTDYFKRDPKILAYVAFESTLNGLVWQVQHMGNFTDEQLIPQIFKYAICTHNKSIQSKTNLNPYETKLWFELLFTDLNVMLYDISSNYVLNLSANIDYIPMQSKFLLEKDDIVNRLTWIIGITDDYASFNIYGSKYINMRSLGTSYYNNKGY